MNAFRIELKVEYREYYIVDADDEEQAAQMALSGSLEPLVREAIPGSEEVTEIEEIE